MMKIINHRSNPSQPKPVAVAYAWADLSSEILKQILLTQALKVNGAVFRTGNTVQKHK